MKGLIGVVVGVVVLVAGLAFLFVHHQESSTTGQRSPYVGQERQALKALMPTEVDALLSGEGMGFAKVAELNQYPGPRHVLDLAEALQLTPAQQRDVQASFDRMQATAIALGEAILTDETSLEALFAGDQAHDAEVEVLIHAIANRYAALRYTHIKAHLEMKALLTPEQVHRYEQERGYGQGRDPAHHGHM